MKFQDIFETKKRIEFNLTEPEVLSKLVSEATLKGGKVQSEMKRLKKLSEVIAEAMKEEGMILTEENLKNIELMHKLTLGIDGSFQLVGGAGGKWYAPISVVRVILEDTTHLKPKVDAFWVGIEEIDENVYPYLNPRYVAELIMLAGETKAIFNWGTKNIPSTIFIDGPIVDPPMMDIKKEDNINYIKDRCEGIRKCLDHSIIIGCVKRSRDRFYIKYLEEIFSSNEEIISALKAFSSDQYLMAYVFAQIRNKGYSGSIFTNWINLSDANISGVDSPYKVYRENGIYIASLFFQKNMTSPVLRLDVPFLKPLDNNQDAEKIIFQVVKAADLWTYPGQDYPLPVYLAHDKCNIREGCAQILYEEIMTKSSEIDTFNQIILTQLR